jgi:adenine/guanine phosphoribosyltransferase-like PRPP-binding protein
MPAVSKKKVTAATYLQKIVTAEGMGRAVLSLTKRLKPIAHEFDAVAFRGFSGALVAPNVAQRLRKDVIFVRKPGEMEHSHSCRTVEGVESRRYIIIDDFVGFGTTVEEMVADIEESQIGGELVGIALYGTERLPCSDVIKNLMTNKNVWVLHNGVERPQKKYVSPDF